MNVKELKWHIRNGLIKPKYFYIPLIGHESESIIRFKFDYDTGGDIYISQMYISYNTYSFMHENGTYDQNYKGYAFETDTEWRFPVPDPSQWEIYPVPDLSSIDISVRNGTISSRYNTSFNVTFSEPQTLVEISGLPPGVYYISPTRPSSVSSWTYYPTYYTDYDSQHYVSHSSGYGMIDRNGKFSGFSYSYIYDSQQIGYDFYCASTKFANDTMPVIGRKQRVVRFVVALVPSGYNQATTTVQERYAYDSRTILHYDYDRICYFHIVDYYNGVDKWIDTTNNTVFRYKKWDVHTEQTSSNYAYDAVVKIYDGDRYIGSFCRKTVASYKSYEIVTGNAEGDDSNPPEPPSGRTPGSSESRYSLYTITDGLLGYDSEQQTFGTLPSRFDTCYLEPDDTTQSMPIAYGMVYSGEGLNSVCGREEKEILVKYPYGSTSTTRTIDGKTDYTRAGTINVVLTASSRERYNSNYRYPGIRVWYSSDETYYAAPSSSGINAAVWDSGIRDPKLTHINFPGIDHTEQNEARSVFLTLLSNSGEPISETLPDSPDYTFDETTGELSGTTVWMDYKDGMTKALCTEYLTIFKNGYVSGGAIEIGVEN